MTDTLEVDLNREGLQTLEVPERFEAGGPFTVAFDNHGEAVHVYLNLDDRLSEVARIEATNHYVEGGERRRVDVQVRDPSEWPSETVRGKLKVVAAHGRETHFVDVTFDATAEKRPVEVDPDLSQPQPDRGRDDDTSPMLRALPVAVLGAVAIILAIGALVAGQGMDLLLGGFAVVAGAACAVAAYYLLG